MALSEKQRRWVEYYLGKANGNATEACRLAGYTGTHGVLRVTGHRMLTNANIRAEIQTFHEANAMPAAEVLSRLTQHAKATLEPFLNVTGENVYLDLTGPAAQSQIHLIKKVKTKRRSGGKEAPWEEFETEIELHDPQAALVHLGRNLKLFTDRQEIGGADGAPILFTLEAALSKVYGDSDDGTLPDASATD